MILLENENLQSIQE